MKRLLIIIILALSFITTSQAQIINNEMQILMERFCKQCYNDCFAGRKYLDGSLVVTSVELSGSTVKVRGRHNYTGYLGKTYSDVDFKADITYDSGDVVVVFYKWFVPAVKLIDGHWESCEKRIGIN